MESASPARANRHPNALTRLVMAASAMAVTLAQPRWAPLLILLVVLVVAGLAHRLRAIAIVVGALFPLLLSTVVVNAVWPAGGDRLDGVRAALVVLSLSLPPALLFLTTPLGVLLADLEASGLSARAAFVLGAAVAAVPRARARALRVADARRARGLDRDGSWPGRLRGILELTGPVVYGSLVEVEERTLALESRGFGRVRRRTILQPSPTRRLDRLLRYGLGGAAAAALLARVVLR